MSEIRESTQLSGFTLGSGHLRRTTGLAWPYFCEFLDPAYSRYTERVLRQVLPTEPAGLPASERFCDGLNYILCYVPRSGSTHLTSLLRNSGIMGKPADLFNLEYRRLTVEARQVLEETGVHTICEARQACGTETVGEYLAHLAAIARTPNGVFGIKVDLYQASILMRRGLFWGGPLTWKYVYLTRRDLVMQAISLYRALKTDVWSSTSGSPQPACEFDAGAVLSQVRTLANTMAQWEFVFASLGIAPMRVTYEEIEADPRNVLARLASHVGVDCPVENLPLHSCCRKQRTTEDEQWAVDSRRAASEINAGLGTGLRTGLARDRALR